MNNNFVKEFTVWQANEYIRMLLDSDMLLGDISIKGEISNFKHYTQSGHMYFSLKDDQAVLKCVMFKSYASSVGFAPKDGMRVVARGKISAYPRDGVYQLYVSFMKEDGRGNLFERLEQLKKKLGAEGLFDPSAKKPLPKYPKTVGIITSTKGAALRDMLNVLERRNPLVNPVIYPSAVQGEGAWRELTAGIDYFTQNGGVDVIIIGRGGGAYEDLWEFNNESLARAIYNCPIPVISAVGHETDFTVCDFVADMRAPTPSAAAELAVPVLSDIISRLDGYQRKVTGYVESQLEVKKSLLEGYRKRCVQGAGYLISSKKSGIESLQNILVGKLGLLLEKKKSALCAKAAELEALNPLSVLSRGYGYVSLAENGAHVGSYAEVKKGDAINVQLRDGNITATVECSEMSEQKEV